jgi:HAD superfamily hydrolase (TIGR01549 family)
MIRMVCFDVGETLIDETRHWGEWADWMGVPRLTFFAAFGMVIAQGRHHRDVFELLRPGFDHDSERAKRIAQGWRYRFEPEDFYPDAVPCLSALREQGYRIGIAGNQWKECESEFRRHGIAIDLLASSESWGVEKPSSAFFARLIAEAGLPPGVIAYVGDRADNDIVPVINAGMKAIFIRRGPWGIAHAKSRAAAMAHARIDSLDELTGVLAEL